MVVNPIQVETETGENEYYYAKPGYKLTKGAKRVSLINNEHSLEVLDVVIHNEEAYVRPSVPEFDENQHLSKDVAVVSMSSSINHDLLLIQQT